MMRSACKIFLFCLVLILSFILLCITNGNDGIYFVEYFRGSNSVKPLPLYSVRKAKENNLYAFDFRANRYEDMQAPEFHLEDLDGKFVSLKDFQDSPVILFFWTTWCPHCRRQIRILNEEYNNIKSLGMELLAVDINEPKGRIKQFADKYSIRYPILLDSYGLVASKYDILGVPTLVLISKESKIISVTNNLPYNYKEILSQ